MLLQKIHFEILNLIKENTELKDIFKNFEKKDVIHEAIKDLFVMGFIELKEGKLFLTPAGVKLTEGIKKFLNIDKDIFIGPEVIDILKIYKKTKYLPEKWISYLKKVGLYEHSLNEDLCNILLDAYELSLNYMKFELDDELLNFLIVIPPGPNELKELIRYKSPFRENIIKRAVMLKLITFSVDPKTEKIVYQLTLPAKLLLELSNEIYLTGISERLLNVLKKDVSNLSAEEIKELQEKGYIDLNKELTKYGKKLLKIRELLGKELPIPYPYYILKEEILVLDFIKRCWEHYKEHGTEDVLPTEDYIIEKLNEKYNLDKLFLEFIIKQLFVKDYVKYVIEKNKDILELTEIGYKVLEVFKDLNKDITTFASKSVLYSLTNNAPIYTWVQEAKEVGLIKEWITKKGKLIVDLAIKPRKILLSKYALIAIYKVAVNKYYTLEDLIKIVKEYLSEKEKKEENIDKEIELSIIQAESYGLFFIEKNDMIILTKIGKLIKEMLEYAKTEEIINTIYAINPNTIHILKIIKDYEDEIKSRIKKGQKTIDVLMDIVTKELKITENLAKKYITILHKLGLLGDISITKGGECLLQAAKTLEEEAVQFIY